MFSSKLKFLSVFVLVALIWILTQMPSASAKLSDALPNVLAPRTSIADTPAFLNVLKANGEDDSNKFSPNACVQTPTDLISWYRAENNAHDSQGANHGALQNGTGFAAGKVGQSFNFTALNQSVEIPDDASLDLTNAVTLEAWVSPSQIGAANDGTTIVTKGDLTAFGNQPFGLFYNSAGRVVMRVGNSSTFSVNTISATVLPLNTFSHVVGTYDGTTAKIYVNGVLEDSDNEGIGAMTTNNLPVRIGANNLSGFLGKIDEASIYSRALTDTEIQSMFNAGTAGKCLAPPPVCSAAPVNQVSWYRAENNANDSAGANHGTLQNGTAFAAGKVGQAFSFDGVDDVVSVPDNSSLNPSGSLTIEAWVNPNAGITVSTAIISKWNDLGGNTNTAYALTVEGGNNARFAVVGDNGVFRDVQSNAISLNTFTHIAGVFDGQAQTLRIFVNGVQSGTTATTNFNSLRVSSAPLLIGAGDFGGGSRRFMNGQIDEASIYNRALSDAEIQAIFNADSAGKCLSPTAASVQVGGRVTTAKGRGISRARVELTDARGDVRAAYTNSFGYYRFETIVPGQTYVFTVRTKQYAFAANPSILFVTEDTSNVNFTVFP